MVVEMGEDLDLCNSTAATGFKLEPKLGERKL